MGNEEDQMAGDTGGAADNADTGDVTDVVGSEPETDAPTPTGSGTEDAAPDADPEIPGDMPGDETPEDEPEEDLGEGDDEEAGGAPVSEPNLSMTNLAQATMVGSSAEGAEQRRASIARDRARRKAHAESLRKK